MEPDDSPPLLLSPNLGCPQIVPLGQEATFHVLVATRQPDRPAPTRKAFEQSFRLVPSFDGEGQAIDLTVIGEPRPVSDWNHLSDFAELAETRLLVNSELHYKVLGRGTTYSAVRVGIDRPDDPDLLRDGPPGSDSDKLPTLYDLVTLSASGEYRRVNPHAVQLVSEIAERDCRFLHLTDAHVARRNDEMLDEIVKESNDRPESEIRKTFVNFNDNFRRVIEVVNGKADRGELDFVILTGDLVDQAFHGWDDESNDDENNYKEFIDIVTGSGLECNRGNRGLRIAVFTSTGNHDWRLHPYDPAFGRAATFGLTEGEAKNYLYSSFDATEYPEDERSRLAREISHGALEKIQLDSLRAADRWRIRLGKVTARLWSALPTPKGLFGRWLPGVAALHLGSMPLRDEPVALFRQLVEEPLAHLGRLGIQLMGEPLVMLGRLWADLAPYLAIGIAYGLLLLARRYSRSIANMLVDNPLHAEATALHYYFTHINPYLDYGFSYGRTHFIMMDGGADAFLGDILGRRERKRLKRLSISDNLIGGAPDTRCFDSDQLYLNWSQTVWLTKALGADGIGDGDPVFLGIHTPPVNVPGKLYRDLGWRERLYCRLKCMVEPDNIYKELDSWDELWESNPEQKTGQAWISREELDLTYGSISRYLSQLFYLCFGLTEGDDYRKDTGGYTRRVTMVLAGHAHRNIEFSVDLRWDGLERRNDIRIFSDCYSDPEFDLADDWRHRPLLIQTAACGPEGQAARRPPYYRQLDIIDGVVQTFRVFSAQERPEPDPAPPGALDTRTTGA